MSNSGPYGLYEANMGPQPADPAPGIGFTIIVAGNPNTLGTTGPAGSFAYDSVSGIVYYSADGTTWTAITSGGTPSQEVYSGHGNPNGVVTATEPSLYYDLDSGVTYQKTGSGSSGWN